MKVATSERLRQIYGHPKGRSVDKQLDALETHSINFIAHSPFVLLSTVDGQGNLDVSPRGGAPGFVARRGEGQLIIPDAKGNKRLDSLENIIATGRVGALFLVPGVDETLRLNGSAYISEAEQDLALFAADRHPPQTCIVVNVEEVFLHCAKALMRSELWAPSSAIERSSFPTMAQMINEQLGVKDIPESQEEMLARYQGDL